MYQNRDDVNDYAYYSDSDQDAARVVGNMILGLMNAGNQPEPSPLILAFNQWAESTETADMGLGLGQILVRGNVIEDSTFCSDDGCTHTIGIDFVEEGQVINGVGGAASFLEIYRDMYRVIRDENFPQIGAIPGAQQMRNRLAALIDLFGGELPIAGDFNDDGALDGADIDTLVAEIANGMGALAFDLNGDGSLDLADRDAWLTDAGAANLVSGNSYLLGDANLDGVVDGQDFLAWNANKFQSTGSWSQADWNADGITDGQDFLIWNNSKFQSADAAAVPEPSAAWLGCVCVLILTGCSRPRPRPRS